MKRIHCTALLSLLASCIDTHAPSEYTAASSVEPPLPLDAYLGGVAADQEAPAEMKAYLAAFYDGVVASHQFTMEDGRTVDCVDVATQPALRDQGIAPSEIEQPPALEDSAPSELEGEVPAPGETVLTGELDVFGLEKACEAGTVPIVRLALADMMRFSSVSAFLGKDGDLGGDPELKVEDGAIHGHAVATRPNLTVWGLEGFLNVWDPYVSKGSKEMSLAQLWVIGGEGALKQTLEAGWQDYPAYYGAEGPHLFIFSTRDNYASTGCYNLTCSDFVQLDSSIVIGAQLAPVSTKGGAQARIRLRWQKNGAAGGWWLRYEDTWVGYYPAKLYTVGALGVAATKALWGGEAAFASDEQLFTNTDIGSGERPTFGSSLPAENFREVAYIRRVRQRAMGASGAWSDLGASILLGTGSGGAPCYSALGGMAGGTTWGSHAFFGGGGYSQSCYWSSGAPK